VKHFKFYLAKFYHAKAMIFDQPANFASVWLSSARRQNVGTYGKHDVGKAGGV
jgi:hypothetical protein